MVHFKSLVFCNACTPERSLALLWNEICLPKSRLTKNILLFKLLTEISTALWKLKGRGRWLEYIFIEKWGDTCTYSHTSTIQYEKRMFLPLWNQLCLMYLQSQKHPIWNHHKLVKTSNFWHSVLISRKTQHKKIVKFSRCASLKTQSTYWIPIFALTATGLPALVLPKRPSWKPSLVQTEAWSHSHLKPL